MIHRQIEEQIRNALNSRKAIIIMGARQVGKSTLLQTLFGEEDKVLWLNGDDIDVQSLLSDVTSTRLRTIVADNNTVVIDEAQRIANIGLRLKLITDQMSGVQLVATGSSSFELANRLNEPLTGRKREFKMFPLTFSEMAAHASPLEELRLIPHRMLYGYYPEVVTSPGQERVVLKELSESYLYRDVMQLDAIRNPERLIRLLKAIALQIGSQVSYNELGNLIGIDSKTVERYIDVLEQSYIVFRLRSFARNQRNELKRNRKIYFWDLGIRNALIANFAQIENRTDVGQLWENFVIAERLKQCAYKQSFTQSWFWRTRTGNEIDYLEETDGTLHAYELKWNTHKGNAKCPKAFSEAYADATYQVITPNNVETLLLNISAV